MGCCGVWLFLIDLSFPREQSPWSFSGLKFCVLIYWGYATPLLSLRELFWGMLGRGDDGLRGIGVWGSGHNEVLALEVINVI